MLETRRFLHVGIAALALAGPTCVQAAQAPTATPGGGGQIDRPPSGNPIPGNPEQGPPPPATGLEDIVVTASKRAENSQKVAAAVTAVSGGGLAKLGITDQTQLQTAVPSLVIGAKGGVSGLVFLRGIGQTVGSSNAQDGVAINYNGVYLQHEIGVSELFDLERVEALPGPQGTLYGGSAAGGIINYQTARPTTKFEGNLSVEGGNYGLIHTIGAVNVPITDRLAVRVAGNYDHHDGYESNGLDDAQSLNGRVTVSWQPTADLSLLGLVQYDHRGGKGPGNQLKGLTADNKYQKVSDPWYNSYPTNGLYIHSNDVIALGQVNYHFADHLNLTYIGAYGHSRTNEVLEFQFLYGGPFQTINSGFRVRMNQYSQELRLSNDTGGRSKWLAGLYWAESDHFFELAAPQPGVLLVSTIANKLHNYAAYGQYSYSVLDQLRLIAGVRFSSDSFNGGGGTVLPPVFGRSYTYGGKKTKHRVDWKAGIEYDFRPQSMAYATVQTGFVQGGFTQTPLSSGLPGNLKPETLTSYTVGMKNRFLQNRLQINDEAFYYDYKDLQEQLLQGTITVGVNFPKSRIYGNQLDIDYLLTKHDALNLSVTYLDARVKSGQLPGFAANFRNFQLPGAPGWTAAAGLSHDFDISNGGKVTLAVRTYYNSGYWETFTHDINSHQGSYTKTDLNLTYFSPSNWSIGGFLRNVENSAVYSACAGATAPGNPVGCFIQPPRTYGFRLEGRF